jgi:hypothetical protein
MATLTWSSASTKTWDSENTSTWDSPSVNGIDAGIISVVATSANNAISPTISVSSNIGIVATVANTSTQMNIPFVGSAKSVQIVATIGNAQIDGIVPSISVAKGVNIGSVVANTNTNAISPTLKIDVTISAKVGGVYSIANPPVLNAKIIIGDIELKGSMDLYVTLQGSMDLFIDGLKGGVTMTIEGQDIFLSQGESKYLGYTVPDTISGLNGAIIQWVIYNSKGVLLEKAIGSGITITDSDNGKFQVKLESVDTQSLSGRYRYIVKVTDQFNNTSDVTKGTINIDPSPRLAS